MLRFINMLLWLTLVTLAGAMIAAAVAAAAVFSTLPQMQMRLEQYPAFPAEKHGLLAAGHVMDKVFAAVNMIVWMCAPAACGLMLICLALLHHAPGRRVRLFAFVLLLLGGGTVLYYQAMDVPRMNQHLHAYRQAAARGDSTIAEAEHSQFTALHKNTDLFFRASAIALVVAIGCWAWGSTPGRAAATVKS